MTDTSIDRFRALVASSQQPIQHYIDMNDRVTDGMEIERIGVKLAHLIADPETIELVAKTMFEHDHAKFTSVPATEAHWRMCSQDHWREKALSILEYLAQKAGE